MSHCICNNTRVFLSVANESPANAAPRHRTEPLTRLRWSPAVVRCVAPVVEHSFTTPEGISC